MTSSIMFHDFFVFLVISDNQFQFKDTATGNYIVYDANTGNYETFFEYSRLSNITGISQVQFSPDRKYALVSYGCVQVESCFILNANGG